MEQKNFQHEELIQNEYRRIDGKWLKMQYQLMLWLVVFATAAELLMTLILRELGAVSTSPQQYLFKYVLTPFACNLAVCVAATALIHSEQSERRKIYGVSIAMALMAFFTYSVHSVWESLFLVFVVPMAVTIVYGDQRLTGLVAALCLGGKAASDLFIFWDPDRPNVLASEMTAANFGLSMLLLALFYGICRVLISVEQEKNNVSIDLERERRRYQTESLTDALTGLWNRQALRESFQKLEVRKETASVFLAMLDLDDFKSLNDSFGHRQGDLYLKSIGRVLREVGAGKVYAFRFGGDEFCLLFYDCTRRETEDICRQIQVRFAREEINRCCRAVSVSIGVARFRQGERPTHLLERADTALYRAKQEKGSICLAADNE